MASKVSAKSHDESVEKIPGLQAAGLHERKDSLHATVPLLAGGTLGSFTPEHSETEHAFGMIVCGRNTFLDEKEPKGIELLFKPPGKFPRCVLAVSRSCTTTMKHSRPTMMSIERNSTGSFGRWWMKSSRNT